MEEKPLISILLPIYNVEKFLPKCLNSILCQTYEKLEIILVDDGSPDNCATICDEYAKKDSRIKVIHQENMDVSGARNTALKAAKGNFITFVDPDDYVDKEYIKYLYEILKKNNCDISTCGETFVYEDGTLKSHHEEEKCEIYTSYEALELMLYQKKVNNSPCGKLYKRELFKNIWYPLGKRYEDLGTTYKLFLNARNIAVGNKPYYYYFQSVNSIVRSTFNTKTLDIIEMAEQMERDILKIYPEFQSALQSRVLNAHFFIIRQLPKKKFPSEYKKSKEYIKKNRFKVLKNPKVRLKTKLGILISYLGIGTLKKFYNLLNRVYFVKKLD